MAQQIGQVVQDNQNGVQVINAPTEQIFKFQDITPFVRQILRLLRDMHVQDRDYLDRRSEVLEKLYRLEVDKELSTYATNATKACIIGTIIGQALNCGTSLLGSVWYPGADKISQVALKKVEKTATIFSVFSEGFKSLQHFWELGNDGARKESNSKETLYENRKSKADQDENSAKRHSDDVENELNRLIDQKSNLVANICRAG